MQFKLDAKERLVKTEIVDVIFFQNCRLLFGFRTPVELSGGSRSASEAVENKKATPISLERQTNHQKRFKSNESHEIKKINCQLSLGESLKENSGF